MSITRKKTPDIIDVCLSRHLRQMRDARKISRAQLAEAVGTSWQQVYKYGMCLDSMSASCLFRFAQIHSVLISYFCEDITSLGADKQIGYLRGNERLVNNNLPQKSITAM